MEILFTPPLKLVKRQFNDGHSNTNYRSEFMRDRDRVLYSTAFRRLAGKTQIYTIGSDDHKRNRLTHTLEVSQIARTIASALNLDVDLADAIALGHDLGHTPFGHAGERILNSIMQPCSDVISNSPLRKVNNKKLYKLIKKEKCPFKNILDYSFGFKHNLQGLRVAALLEDSYRDEMDNNIGLNLTNYSLWGIVNHSSLFYKDDNMPPNFQKQFKEHLLQNGSSKNEAWSFEAYVVKIADDIAQWHHDLEDALRGDAISKVRILKLIEKGLGESISSEDKVNIKKLEKRDLADKKYLADLSHIVVNTLINDVIDKSIESFNKLENEILEKDVKIIDVFKNYEKHAFSIPKEKVVDFSDKIDTTTFRRTIRNNVHHSQDVERMNGKGKYIIRKIFEAYLSHPQQLPDGPIMHFMVEIGVFDNIDEAKKCGVGEVRTKFENQIQKRDMYKTLLLMRRICDHIASMTDHYAIEEYNNLYG